MVEEKENRIRDATEAEAPRTVDDKLRILDGYLEDSGRKVQERYAEVPAMINDLKEAREFVRQKTTHEELLDLKGIAGKAAWVTGAVSVFTGFPAGYYIVNNALAHP